MHERTSARVRECTHECTNAPMQRADAVLEGCMHLLTMNIGSPADSAASRKATSNGVTRAVKMRARPVIESQ